MKRRLIPIVRQLVQKVVIGKTAGHRPATLQVHGMIASILASMDVLDLMTKRYLAEVQNDFEEKLAAGELATEAKRKELLNR
ncbi:hypothetical protein [Rhizobium mongolense]|uniref:hypothetical protein n=1 Tax=Rhizobium mongolense TaxID=57676 RepID=UPI0034A5D1C5